MADNNVEMGAVQPTGVSNSRSRYGDLEYDPKRVAAKEVRNAMLVVAALISAATFAAGINPPGGVWQADGTTNSTVPIKYHAGKSVLATNRLDGYKMFFFGNAVAFSAANQVIFYLVYGFPYFPEIWAGMAGMSLAFGVSIGAVSPPDSINRGLLVLALLGPYIARPIACLLKKCCGNWFQNVVGAGR